MSIFNRQNRFERMFEGYEQQTFFDASGRAVTRMVYTGPRYRANLSDTQRIIYKVLFPLLFVVAVAMQIIAGVLRVPANYSIYANLPEAAALVVGIFTGVYVVTYVTAIKEMEKSRYKKNHFWLRLFSGISAALALVNTVAFLVVTLIMKATDMAQSWLGIVFHFLAFACYLVIFVLESKTAYDELSPEIY